MKSMASWLASGVALLCLAGVQAAETPKTNVIRDYSDTVAPADQLAYEAGIKSYNRCLNQHGFKYTWTAWTHETGNTYTYSYISPPGSWSSFDAMQVAGKACDASFKSEVNPHLKGETSAFMVIMPELSLMPADMGTPSALMDVTYFTLKPGHDADEAFTSAVKKIIAAAEKSHWPGHAVLMRIRGGDQGAPDYILASPYKSWADLGAEPDPPLWKMLENVYGKQDAAALRKSLNDAIQDESSHVDSYNADLTYPAAQ